MLHKKRLNKIWMFLEGILPPIAPWPYISWR